MSPEELEQVLHYLHHSDSGFRLPYDCVPLLDGPITQEDWEGKISFNPPHGQDVKAPDPLSLIHI